ncbi:DUF7288 family protein [Methanolobus halotolerans]|uniref:Uncharacterized protein n=1 Tax=Methanolobus halotolerans TaxID=2052935 RepID=A0A4E0PUW0_9EURY|nr:hypothetical protein [Methanolobus halotolerans]TGC07302.1 hypothetical protein CUN85_11655 [Methanolobus halotolerans]
MADKESCDRLRSDSSAQLHTLEALMALLLIIGVIVFTVQATSLTPLTSSTANAHIEAQLQILGQDILNSLDYAEYGQDSPLKKDILDWNGAQYTWNSTEYHANTNRVVNSSEIMLNSSTATILESIAIKKGIAHNLEITWIEKSGTSRSMPYIYNGEPSDNAVIVTKRVLLSDSDFPGTNSSDFRSNTGIVDADDTTDFYNLIDVKLTMWRM